MGFTWLVRSDTFFYRKGHKVSTKGAKFGTGTFGRAQFNWSQERFLIPLRSMTIDMNCFYDGVPSLRCATFGMTGAREGWSGRRGGAAANDKNSSLTPLRCVRDDRRSLVLGEGLAGREIPLCVRNRRRPANPLFFSQWRRVMPNGVRHLFHFPSSEKCSEESLSFYFPFSGKMVYFAVLIISNC